MSEIEFESNMETLVVIPLLLILSVATLIDQRTRKVPNVLSFGGALFGIILQGTINGGPGIALAAGGWLLCLACFLPLYVSGGMAAGDVKLMAAVGAFVGPVTGIAACLFTMIAGAIIGIASVILVRRSLSATRGEDLSLLRCARQARIPYAGAIAAGTSFVLLVPSVIPSALRHLGDLT
jgi:prepilin peptidase CpaA